ncbi:MAG: hypothetical protein QOJ25_347, partial [Solirubrobacteraceae bacterium]|nr:hypothetical protein [Solirubrobacteraceae bacterium]
MPAVVAPAPTPVLRPAPVEEAPVEKAQLPAAPAEPEAPAQPAQPAKPEAPAQPAEPEAPAQPAKPETPAQPAEPAEPERAPREEPPRLDLADPPEPTWGWTEPWSFELPAPDAPTRRPRAKSRRRPAKTRRAPARPRPRPRPRRRRGHPLIALLVIVLAAAVTVWIAIPHSPPASPTDAAAISYSPHPSAVALQTIPAAYLRDYGRAAAAYGLDWTKLAAVGQIESNQGRSPAPGVAAGTNPAGAAGPAQFLGSTWARYGVDADGRGSINPYDPADAITAMAAYLKASGAPEDWRKALFSYNHSSDYVDAVLALSRRYRGGH